LILERAIYLIGQRDFNRRAKSFDLTRKVLKEVKRELEKEYFISRLWRGVYDYVRGFERVEVIAARHHVEADAITLVLRSLKVSDLDDIRKSKRSTIRFSYKARMEAQTDIKQCADRVARKKMRFLGTYYTERGKKPKRDTEDFQQDLFVDGWSAFLVNEHEGILAKAINYAKKSICQRCVNRIFWHTAASRTPIRATDGVTHRDKSKDKKCYNIDPRAITVRNILNWKFPRDFDLWLKRVHNETALAIRNDPEVLFDRALEYVGLEDKIEFDHVGEDCGICPACKVKRSSHWSEYEMVLSPYTEKEKHQIGTPDARFLRERFLRELNQNPESLLEQKRLIEDLYSIKGLQRKAKQFLNIILREELPTEFALWLRRIHAEAREASIEEKKIGGYAKEYLDLKQDSVELHPIVSRLLD
jgi:hypothetical protein